MTLRAGRPRIESRGRFRGGQIRPLDAGITAAQLHRLREISRDPWLGSRVGQLLFLGHLTQTEADCGWQIAVIYGRYERAMGLHRSGASPAYERGYGHDQSDESEADAKRRQRAIRRYERLIDKISLLGIGTGILKDIERLCVDDLAAEPMTLPRIRQALGMLADALGVKPQRPK